MKQQQTDGYVERRGGKRANSGRKKCDSPIVTYSVDITHAQAELLKRWGAGNLSAGLRWLVDAAEVLVRKKSVPVTKDAPAQ